MCPGRVGWRPRLPDMNKRPEHRRNESWRAKRQRGVYDTRNLVLGQRGGAPGAGSITGQSALHLSSEVYVPPRDDSWWSSGSLPSKRYKSAWFFRSPRSPRNFPLSPFPFYRGLHLRLITHIWVFRLSPRLLYRMIHVHAVFLLILFSGVGESAVGCHWQNAEHKSDC
jgi:hypothetical protein